MIPPPTEADLARDADYERLSYMRAWIRRAVAAETLNRQLSDYCGDKLETHPDHRTADGCCRALVEWLEGRAERAEALNRQLADRLAAASAVIADRAERFEQEAYMEGWKTGNLFLEAVRAGFSRGLPDSLQVLRCWAASESAKRLANGGRK